MKKKRIISLLLSVLLISGLFATSVLPTYAASSKSMYVLKSVSTKDISAVNTFKYDSKGRLKTASLLKGMQKCKFTYNSKNQITKFSRSFNDWCNFNYSYNSKGRLTKIKGNYYSLEDNKYAYDGLNSKFTYNSKGQVTKEVVTEKKKTYTNKYTYNSKGQVKKVVIAYPGRKGTYTFKYDKKGNVKAETIEQPGWSCTISFKNTYDSKGRLSKCKVTETTSEGETNSTTYTYKYSRITVSSKYVKAVKAQQWTLLNEPIGSTGRPMLSFYMPRNDYNGM